MLRYFLLYIFIFLSIHGFSEKIPVAVAGVLDLSKQSISEPIPLSGEWKFTYNPNSENELKGYISVPSTWKSKRIDNKKIPGTGYAFYELKIILPSDTKRDLGIKVKNMATAHAFYINKTLMGKAGKYSETALNNIPSYKPYIIPLTNYNTDTLQVLIKISNFHHHKGGVWDKIEIGSLQKIFIKQQNLTGYELFLFGAILIMALYHFGLFLMRKEDKAALFFGLFSFTLSIRILFSGQYSIYYLIPNINWFFIVHTEYISFYIAVTTFMYYMYYLFINDFRLIIAKTTAIVTGITILLTLILPTQIFTNFILYYEIFTVIPMLYSFYILYLSIKRKRETALLFALGFLILLFSYIHDALMQHHLFSSIEFIPIGVFLFIFIQSYLLSFKFSNAFKKNKELGNELNVINKNLEEEVEKRTFELNMQTIEFKGKNKALRIREKELEEANAEIAFANKELIDAYSKLENQQIILEEQKSLIESRSNNIIDSISYAAKIQRGLLPDSDYFKSVLPKSFIFYRPKDVVSGDFYWIKELNGKLLIVGADCTGHGVPGAMMSILGIAFLNEITRNFAELKAALRASWVLDELRKQIKQTLKQTGSTYDTQDGMDLALCLIDKKTLKMQYAGANNSIIIASDTPFPDNLKPDIYIQEKLDNCYLLEIKPDKMPVGIYYKEGKFKNKTIKLSENDSVYLFSDGYIDQFGGTKNKKLKKKAFKQLIAKSYDYSCDEKRTFFRNQFFKWKRNTQQTDDVIVIGFKPDFEKKETNQKNFEWSEKKIMIIDDEEMYITPIKEILKETKATIITFNSGITAFNYLKQNNVNIIISDIYMPNTDGYETLKLLRENNINTPVIFQTASIDPMEKEKSFKMGCRDLLIKPISKNELLQTIKKYF